MGVPGIVLSHSLRKGSGVVLLTSVTMLVWMLSSGFCSAETCGNTLGPYFWTDVVFLPNATDFIVASANITKRTTAFGIVSVFDDPLTTGDAATGTAVGRVQGEFMIVSKDGKNGMLDFTVVLSQGTISFSGYLSSAYLTPPSFNRVGITSGNGVYNNVTRGFADLVSKSSAFQGQQETYSVAVSYCTE